MLVKAGLYIAFFFSQSLDRCSVCIVQVVLKFSGLGGAVVVVMQIQSTGSSEMT